MRNDPRLPEDPAARTALLDQIRRRGVYLYASARNPLGDSVRGFGIWIRYRTWTTRN